MLRWSEDQLREHHAKRQGRVEAKAEAKDHQADQPRAKYRNKKVQIDGRTFDSKLEGRVYVDLKRQQEAGLITALQCQVKFALEVHGVLIAHYIADFTFRDSSFAFVVADAKGVRTREYILKKKLMKACHGIDIKEYRREKSRTRKPNPV